MTSSPAVAIPAARSNVAWVPLPDGAVLFCPDTEAYYGLDVVGTHIWELLAQPPKSLDALRDAVQKKFPDSTPEQLQIDLTEFLADLEQSGLVANAGVASAA